MRRKFLRPWLLPFALCALYVMLISFTARPNLNDEAEAYFNYGHNLLTHGTYGIEPGVPDDLREPGYGLFLAFLMAPLQPFQPAQPLMLKWIVLAQAALFALTALFFFHRAQLPLLLRWILFAMLLLSPTLSGTNSVVYSESLVICLMVLMLTALTSPGFPRPRSLALIGTCMSYLLLTKMYLLFFVPLCALGFLALAIRSRGGGLRREAAMRLFLLITLACLPFLVWSHRGKGVERRHRDNDRIVIQFGGKVYRHKEWNLAAEWKPALLASCCLGTCLRTYGENVCNKFTWVQSDPIGYQVLSMWKSRPPEQRQKSVLRETIEYWWSTLPIQLVSSGLELVRIAFFEGAQISAESGFLWLKFAQVWHLLGSLLIWTLAIRGSIVAWGERADPYFRRASIAGAGLIVYHLVVMSQVTNVQRYSVPLLPWFYWFAALAIWRIFLSLKTKRLKVPMSRNAQSK